MMQVTKVWWDGEKLMAEPIDPASVYKEDSTCNKTLIAQGKANPRTCRKCGLGPCIADQVQPAQQEYERGFIDGMQEQMRRSVDRAVNAMAQRTWVGLTANEVEEIFQKKLGYYPTIYAVEAKLKEKNQ